MLYFSERNPSEVFSDLGSGSVSTGKPGLCDLWIQGLALGSGLFPSLLGSKSGAQASKKATGMLNKRKDLVKQKEEPGRSLCSPCPWTSPAAPSLPNPIVSFCARELHRTQFCYKTEFCYNQAQVAQNCEFISILHATWKSMQSLFPTVSALWNSNSSVS